MQTNENISFVSLTDFRMKLKLFLIRIEEKSAAAEDMTPVLGK